MIDQFSHESIPASIYNSTPGPVLDSLQGKVKGEIIGELSDEIHTEAGATFEYCGVGVFYFLCNVDTHLLCGSSNNLI